MSDMQARIERIEMMFGYPFPRDLRKRVESDLDDPDTAPEEVDGMYVGSLVHWRGEQWEGPDPERAAVDALFARLNKPVPPTALRPKDPNLLARHFCGLFELSSEWSRTPTGMRASVHWVADLNPRQDGKPCPVYRFVPGSDSLGPFLFGSIAEFDSWRAALEAIESVDEEADPEQKGRLQAALRRNFPWPVSADHARLVKRGIFEADDVAPVIAPPSDPESERLGRFLSAFGTVAEVLIARSDGRNSTCLAPSVTADALSLAGDTIKWPPAIMLRLQANALSGAMDTARGEAARILEHNEGVALTRRWAERIARGLAPYDR